MPDPGRLRDRLRFEERAAPQDDGFGNQEAGWAERFATWAEVKPLQGGEEVIGARLLGQQPVVIVVRASSRTAAVTSAWRAVDVHSGATYAIGAAVDMDRRGQWITLAATGGAPA